MACRHPQWPDIGLIVAALFVAGGFIAFWAGVIDLTVAATRLLFH